MEAQTMVKVQVTNPSKVERNDEPVVLDLSKYGEVSKAVVTVDGKEIPSQLDDLNRDCVNDELCFLADLGKRESKTYQILLFSEGEQSVYPARTFAELVVPSKNKKLAKNKQDIYLRSIAFDKKTKDVYHFVHSHGVCFESDLVAMRVYFDNRQTIDLYGKINKGLVVEDTQFYPSEEQLAAGSGDDCLWVGNTYGLGALRGWDGTKSLLLTDVKYQEQRVISEGPLRAVVEVVDNGWVPAPGLKPVNATIRYTIYAGHRDFDVEVFFNKNADDYVFSTGLINVKGSTEMSDGKGLRGCYGSDWPTGKDDGKHKLETVGLGIYVPQSHFVSQEEANKDVYTMLVHPVGKKLTYKLAYTSANETYGFPEKRSGISGWRNGRNFRLSHYWSKYFKQDSSLLAFCKTQVSLLSARNCLRVFQKRNNRRETFCCGIPGGKSFLCFPSPISFSPFSFVISHFSFVLSHFIVFLICPFSRLSHFVAQISANVNIYRIDSSFLHIICAFLA